MTPRALRGAVAAGSLALALTFTSSAFAQAPAAATPDAGAKATARDLMDRGDAFVKQGKLEDALRAYRGADKIMQVPTTGLEVGRTELKLNLLLEAADTLLRVTRFPVKAGEPAAYTTARAEAKALSAPIPGRIPSLTIRYPGLPDDVEPKVQIDGRPLTAGTARLPRKLNPGKHTLTGTAPGYRAEPVDVTIADSEQKSVALPFEYTGEAPPPPAPPQPSPEPTPEGSGGVHPLAIAGFATAGVGLVLGGVMGGLALADASSFKEERGCVDGVCDPGTLAEVDDTFAHVSTAGFAVGGVGVVLGVVGLLLPQGDSGGSDAAVHWRVDARGIGGTF